MNITFFSLNYTITIFSKPYTFKIMLTRYHNSPLRLLRLIAVISLIPTSCTENETDISLSGQVEFAINGISLQTDARVTDAPVPSSILITVHGKTNYSKEELKLYPFEDQYISEPVVLRIGAYRLTEFFVLDQDDNVIYASPKAGSHLSDFVRDPLPLDFTVNAEDVAQVLPEVIRTEAYEPKDFGYGSFGFEVVQPFMVAVFGLEEGEYHYISTDLYILHEEDTVLKKELLPAVNKIGLDPSIDSYMLIIEEQGYFRYHKTFTSDELLNYMNTPLEILLEPAITFTCELFPPEYSYSAFYISTDSPAELIIDWGNNQEIETIHVSGDMELILNVLKHGFQFISIKGDLDKIISIYNNYIFITDMDVRWARELQSLRVVNSSMKKTDISSNTKLIDILFAIDSLEEIDLSNNPKLQSIGFSLTKLRYLDFQYQPDLIYLGLYFNPDLSSINLREDNIILRLGAVDCNLDQTSVDNIIDIMFNSLIQAPRYNGELYLDGNSPPSAQGQTKLEEIEAEYNWLIHWR